MRKLNVRAPEEALEVVATGTAVAAMQQARRRTGAKIECLQQSRSSSLLNQSPLLFSLGSSLVFACASFSICTANIERRQICKSHPLGLVAHRQTHSHTQGLAHCVSPSPSPSLSLTHTIQHTTPVVTSLYSRDSSRIELVGKPVESRTFNHLLIECAREDARINGGF